MVILGERSRGLAVLGLWTCIVCACHGILGCKDRDATGTHEPAQAEWIAENVLREAGTAQEAFLAAVSRPEARVRLLGDDALQRIAELPHGEGRAVTLVDDWHGLGWAAVFAVVRNGIWVDYFSRSLSTTPLRSQCYAMDDACETVGSQAAWLFLQHASDPSIVDYAWSRLTSSLEQELAAGNVDPRTLGRRGVEMSRVPWGDVSHPLDGWGERTNEYAFLTAEAIRKAVRTGGGSIGAKWKCVGLLPAIDQGWVGLNAECRRYLASQEAQSLYRAMERQCERRERIGTLNDRMPRGSTAADRDMRIHVAANVAELACSEKEMRDAVAGWLSSEYKTLSSPFTYPVDDPKKSLTRVVKRWEGKYPSLLQVREFLKGRRRNQGVYRDGPASSGAD